MIMKYSVFNLILLIVLVSCNNNLKQTTEAKIEKLDTLEKVDKIYLLPNDEFREKVLSRISNLKDSLVVDTIINKLDKQNLSFCKFIKRMFEIDDSCYALAKEKFPDPSQQMDFSKEHSKSLKILEPRYLKTIGFTDRLADIATTVYAFDKDARNLCGTIR
jgi:hypothetical protein